MTILFFDSPPAPPVARILAAGLVRRLHVDADLALALIAELADRFDLAVACWDRADVAGQLAVPRALTDAEWERIRATAAWSQLASAAAGSRHDIAEMMDEVIAQAGLECATCTQPVTGELEQSLGHCGRCRAAVTDAQIRSLGCPAFGYRRHHRGQLHDTDCGQLCCADCAQLLVWQPDPVCGVCHGRGAPAEGSQPCPCRVLHTAQSVCTPGLGAC